MPGRIIALAVWYFGGAALLVAGYSLGAALACTFGVLAFWYWRSRDYDEHGDPAMPALPEARVTRRRRS